MANMVFTSKFSLCQRHGHTHTHDNPIIASSRSHTAIYCSIWSRVAHMLTNVNSYCTYMNWFILIPSPHDHFKVSPKKKLHTPWRITGLEECCHKNVYLYKRMLTIDYYMNLGICRILLNSQYSLTYLHFRLGTSSPKLFHTEIYRK